MFILFTLQGRENYGTAEEPRWKPKFAGEYRLRISDEELLKAPNKAEFLRALADRAAKQLEQDDTHWKQWVIDWKLVEDDHLTEFERFQLEDGGEIKYPAEVIVLEPEQSAASPNAAAA